MVKLKLERSIDFKIDKIFIKIFLAGLALLGVLPFSFSQEEFNLRNTIESRFKGQYHKEVFTDFLDSMETYGTEYFKNNCSQKACLIRNRGRAAAYKRLNEESYDYYYKAYTHLKECKEIYPSIYIQTLMSLDRFKDFRTNQDLSHQQVIEELLALVNNKEYNKNEEFEKLAANGFYILCDYYRYNLKDYDRALIYGRKSLAIYNKYPVTNSKPLRAFSTIINTFTSADKEKEALPYINQVLEYAKKLNLTEERYTSDMQFMLGAIYLDAEEYDRLDSIHNLISINYPDKTFYRTTYQKGLAAFNQDQFEKAKLYFNNTINILEETDHDSKKNLTDQISFYLADSEINLKNYTEAYEHSLRSMNSSAAQLNIDKDTYKINFSDLIITSPLNFLKSINKYLECISEGNMMDEENFIKTIDKIDSIYFEVQPTLIGPHSANSLADSYHRMVGIALNDAQSYDFEKNKDFITYYLSSGKSLSLFSNFVIKENIPVDKLNTFNELLSRRDKLLSEIETASITNNQKNLDSLSNQHYNNNELLKQFYNNLNEKNLTNLYRDNRFEINEKLKSEFNSGELIIDYFYYDKQFYIYTFFKEKLSFHKIEIEELKTENFKSYFTNIDQFEKLELLNAELSKFFKKLLPENVSEINSIIVIPDGPLLEIPFETIQYEGKELINRFPIHYLNSINDHFKRSNSSTNTKSPYVGFGLKYNNKLLDNLSSSNEIKSLFNETFRLASLPNSIEELNNSSLIFKGDVYSQEQCTKAEFVENSADGNIIHIANHVLLNNSNSFLSSIVFAKDDQPQLLNALEIKALNLNAQLAILSSCNSGVGENFSGNGLRSLGQSFFESGCQSVIVNLWEAGDKSSKKIITNFMNYLKEGLPKSEALRKAKIDFLEQASDSEKHPKYWANIVLIGDDNPISFNSSFPKWLFILGAIVILLLVWKIFGKRKEAT